MRCPSRGCNSVRNRGDGVGIRLYLDQRWRLYRIDALRLLIGPAIYSNSRFFCHVQGRARSEVEVEERQRPSRRYGYLFRPTIMSLHYVEQIRGY
jgi:hypothetical protein